ncbi:MAG TPA: DUF1697 domain-containing protein [Polyangiaceae bacterium]|nr:DUF1697 domain-containing protein [Polyangiaceae bacterium]
MTRYAALLRGVSPMNLKMPDLIHALNGAGFSDVKTVLASGNVVFSGKRMSEAAVERRVEAAVEKHVGKKFQTIVRTIEQLEALLESDPYAKFRVSPKAKRVVTFLRSAPKIKPELPVERDGARLLCLNERELFGAYTRSDKGPVFMTMIDKACGKELQTTRTWDTLRKIVRAAGESA